MTKYFESLSVDCEEIKSNNKKKLFFWDNCERNCDKEVSKKGSILWMNGKKREKKNLWMKKKSFCGDRREFESLVAAAW